MIRLKKIMIVLSLIALVSAVNFIEPSNILTIDDVVDEIKASDLPKLYLEGDISSLETKKEEREISVMYESYDGNFEAYAIIKLQGSSSLAYEKKNYTITFYEDEKFDKKYKFDFGWGKQSKYCLKANWIDKTHSRNIVTARLAAEAQKKYDLFTDTPNNGVIDGNPIEVYSNGKFLGLYTLNIPKDAWMFNMDEDNENHIVLSGQSHGPGCTFSEKTDFDDWEVEVGEDNEETLAKLTRLANFVRKSSEEEFKNNFAEYFNLDSVLNYYVIMEFAQLKDNLAKNMLLVTYNGEIWYTSLYDLDSSWGTIWDGSDIQNYKERVAPNNSVLWKKFEKAFPNEIADRYFELRKDILNSENVMEQFNDFANSIPDKVLEKEKEKWDNIPGYELDQINDFLETRIPVMDEYFRSLYTDEAVVTVVYNKNSDGTITAKLENLRADIIVDGSDTYTFTEDGEYTFFYSDFAGNKKYITASASGVRYRFNN